MADAPRAEPPNCWQWPTKGPGIAVLNPDVLRLLELAAAVVDEAETSAPAAAALEDELTKWRPRLVRQGGRRG